MVDIAMATGKITGGKDMKENISLTCLKTNRLRCMGKFIVFCAHYGYMYFELFLPQCVAREQ